MGEEIKRLILLKVWSYLEYLITKMDLPINAQQIKVLTDTGPDSLYIDYLKL